MTIVSLFPVPLKKLLTDIENLGFSLCLIGGAPRDYLLDRSYLSRDLDFEVRGKTTIELKSFFQSQNITINELPYDIVRVGFLGFDLEFSNPRKEIPLLDNKTHHHFQAILDINFTYEESFKRRDFSLNAIGIELNLKDNKETVIDPFNGVGALQSKTLKEMSDDFFLDSVRFLRLIRFMIKYNFEMSASIQGRLSEFDLSELSVHHFTEEMRKSTKPGIFINAFNNLVSVFYLKVPEKYLFWQSLKFLRTQLQRIHLILLIHHTRATHRTQATHHIQHTRIVLVSHTTRASHKDQHIHVNHNARLTLVSHHVQQDHASQLFLASRLVQLIRSQRDHHVFQDSIKLKVFTATTTI